MNRAPMWLRLSLSATGLVFLSGGAALLWVVFRLLSDSLPALEISTHDRVFWALCGVVALCLVMVAINFLVAAARRQTHNIVPGPTLYLLGVTLVILGLFMALSGAWLATLALVASGVGCMRLEYRSDFI
ncbi:MAG: hypothetical protein AAF465_06905 [Pseudomonadota bacterium]